MNDDEPGAATPGSSAATSKYDPHLPARIDPAHQRKKVLVDPLQVNSRGAYAPSEGCSAPEVTLPAQSSTSSPAICGKPSRLRHDRLRRTVATVLLIGMLVLAFVRPDVSPLVMGVIGGSGLALFGIDVPWSRIPWGLMLGRGGE